MSCFRLSLLVLLSSALQSFALRKAGFMQKVELAMGKKLGAGPEGGCEDLTFSVAGDTLRILAMSDFHFLPKEKDSCKKENVPDSLVVNSVKDGAPTGACSKATMDFIDKVTKKYIEQVDLVVINGDLINFNGVGFGESDLSKFLFEEPGYLKNFAERAHDLNVPVMVTLGNHDSPAMSCVNSKGLDSDGKGPSVLECDVSKDDITVDQTMREQRWASVQRKFNTKRKSICTSAPDKVHGAGNSYATALIGTHKVPLVFLDSGTGLQRNKQPYKDAVDSEALYDWVRPSQIQWMKSKIATANAKGIIFTHHPPAMTTEPVNTFADSFALEDNLVKLSGNMWVGSRNHGKPDQGEKGGKFEPQTFTCTGREEQTLIPAIRGISWSADPKENWKLMVEEKVCADTADKDKVCLGECPNGAEMAFFDGPTAQNSETLMQAASSSGKIAALISGHHHDNDYCAKSPDTNEILFCYGGTAGYTAATYGDSLEFGPRHPSEKLEHQVRMIHYTLPQDGRPSLTTWLVRDQYGVEATDGVDGVTEVNKIVTKY